MMTNDTLPGLTGTTQTPTRTWRSIGRLGSTVRLGAVAEAVAAHAPPGWLQPEDHVPLALALAETVTGRDLAKTFAGLITAEQGRQLNMTVDVAVLEFAQTRAARLATPIAEAVLDAMHEHPDAPRWTTVLALLIAIEPQATTSRWEPLHVEGGGVSGEAPVELRITATGGLPGELHNTLVRLARMGPRGRWWTTTAVAEVLVPLIERERVVTRVEVRRRHT